jgi:hypothetical protein
MAQWNVPILEGMHNEELRFERTVCIIKKNQ